MTGQGDPLTTEDWPTLELGSMIDTRQGSREHGGTETPKPGQIALHRRVGIELPRIDGLAHQQRGE
jgi:hypothetical protein